MDGSREGASVIGALRGRLLERDMKGGVVIDVGGVGYDVLVTGPTSARLGELGAEVTLRIHTRVREDAITLYGFSTLDEKRCFDALIGAHGVGPTVALALLTAYEPMALRHIIATDDSDALATVPGIGKKTAARLLVELKSKFEVWFDDEIVDIGSTTTGVPTATNSAKADVTTALTGLGYGNDEVRAALKDLPDDGTAEDLLRQALRSLAKAAS